MPPGRHPRQGARVTPNHGAHGRRTEITASWEHPSSREVARRLAVLPQGPDSPADLTVQELMALGRWPQGMFTGGTEG
jgi:ABC-type cobalamin/Fe3+-siderophores transport system ATPase subunit